MTETITHEKELAIIIIDQIRAVDPYALMAWGAQKFSVLPSEVQGLQYQLGGVSFVVNGFKFKGTVFVRLMACDTYTVELRAKNQADKIYPEIYCDELMHTIDRLVERD